MIFIGDCHGKTTELEWMLKHNPKINKKFCFQVGDMGLGFKGVNLNKQNPNKFLFIRGNHDDPAKCNAHPNYAGDYGYMDDHELFFLGGAWSIDKAWRTPMVSWWPDEELSASALNQALQIYAAIKPRIVATHEAPSGAAYSMISSLNCIKRDASIQNPAMVPKGEDYDYYKAKLGCVDTRTSQYLQQMFDIHKPQHWVFGHYHLDRDFVIDGTKFHCVNELSTKEIL